MFALISLFFLILPVVLMIWMLAAQRRVRNQPRPERELTVRAPWEEHVKGEGGLLYAKKFDPNEELADADARDDEAKQMRNIGIGL
jgi:hypothetical protein